PTDTPTQTVTNTPTNTPTITKTPTSTRTSTPTTTPTRTPTVTLTPTGTQGPCMGPIPNNPCIPGGGSKTTDCNLEWLAAPVKLNGKGMPKNKIVCYEGDPRCDNDSILTNKSCTFYPIMCLNNSDNSRLPTCFASGISSFEVKKPKLGTGNDAIVTALEDEAGSGGFGVTVVRKKTPLPTPGAATNNRADTCSAPINIVVP